MLPRARLRSLFPCLAWQRVDQAQPCCVATAAALI